MDNSADPAYALFLRELGAVEGLSDKVRGGVEGEPLLQSKVRNTHSQCFPLLALNLLHKHLYIHIYVYIYIYYYY